MSGRYSVAVFLGSLRKAGYSRFVAQALEEVTPSNLVLTTIEIGDLPIYNQDLDPNDAPTEWLEFRQRLKPFDAVLFVTPEHNRSIPSVLKNALDVGSRPPTNNVWDGKPGAIVSHSQGVIGGFGVNHHLRQVLVSVNVPIMAKPEVYIGGTGKLFDSEGRLTNDSTRDFLREFMAKFSDWIVRLR